MASKNVLFDTIQSGVLKPGKYFEYNTRGAVHTLPANEQSVLIVAQRTSGGSIPALTPMQVFSDSDAAAYFGYGSHAHLMVRAAIRANPYLQISVCALDDSASSPVARVQTLAINGPATGSGTFTLYVGNVRYQIGIASADTAATIAANVKAALDADPSLPFTVTIATATLTFTAKNKGTVTNQVDFETAITATGVTATLTATTAGTVDPDISTALASVFAKDYTIIAAPFNDATSLAALKTHLDAISGAMEQRPATGYFGYDGLLASCTTLSSNVNSGRIVNGFLRGTRSPAFEVAAAYAAVKASEEHPARPLNYLPLIGIGAPPINQRLSRTEQEACLANGVAPLEVGPGEVVQIVRAVTTYTKDPQNITDRALLDIQSICVLDYVRKVIRTDIALCFPRDLLSSKTPPRVRDRILFRLYQLEELEIVENVAENEPGIIVERDEQDSNRLNAKIPVNIVNGLHVFAGRIDLIL